MGVARGGLSGKNTGTTGCYRARDWRWRSIISKYDHQKLTYHEAQTVDARRRNWSRQFPQ